MADPNYTEPRRRRTTTTAGRRRLFTGAVAVLAGAVAGTALAAPSEPPEAALAAVAIPPPDDGLPRAHPLLQPIQPMDLHHSIRQVVVGEAGNGAEVGDIALVAPTRGYKGACLYACQFPGQGVSIWRAETRMISGSPVWELVIWQGHWSTAEAVTVTRAELNAAVLGYCVGWLHVSSAHIMAMGSGDAFA